MSKLANKLRKAGYREPRQREHKPIWSGPESDADDGGITFSLLSRFLCCRERFRLLVVEGLKPADTFNHRLEFGQMWHTAEECYAASTEFVTSDWQAGLKYYAQSLCKRYPLQQEQIDHWYNVVKVAFPIYIKHWSEHPDVTDRTPLLQEQTFKVPYKLPSGRTVYLRGKWDSVDLIGKGKKAGIYLQENKTKGDIREVQLQRQLTFDLQTMMYLVALKDSIKHDRWSDGLSGSDGKLKYSLRGVRYNVIRRPLSGGRGTIKRKEPTKTNPNGESKETYYDRLRGIIDGSAEDSPGPSYFFMRWKVDVTPGDVAKFRRECLDPILEQLCDWWSWVYLSVRPGNYGPFSPDDGCENTVDLPVRSSIHWRHPFGVYNVLDEGGSSDVDEYLITGSEVGLQRCENLFPEL